MPVLAGNHLVAVAYVESQHECHFGYDLEDALVALCASLGLAMHLLQCPMDGEEDGAGGPPEAVVERPGAALRVRHFSRDDSVFVDDDYLIKGVAGAILWKLLQDHVQDGRCEFSTRELRLAPALRLPEVCDNLDARLILLQRRLLDRSDSLRIEKTGRGRFRLALGRPVLLLAGEGG